MANYYDGSGSVNVYTDGCCLRNGQYGASAGIGVYWGENDPKNLSEPFYGRQTNNSAEVHAAIRAVQQAARYRIWDITINTDSQFTINGATKWRGQWERNGWRTADGKPVVNKDDFLALYQTISDSGVRVEFRFVPSHSGNKGNVEADRLANEGAACAM